MTAWEEFVFAFFNLDIIRQAWPILLDGLVQTVQDARTNVTTYLHDASRRVEAVLDAQGNRLTYLYDNAGNATVTQPDVKTSNGIVHVVDKVLLPKM